MNAAPSRSPVAGAPAITRHSNSSIEACREKAIGARLAAFILVFIYFAALMSIYRPGRVDRIPTMERRDYVERLMELVELHDLYHVKTLNHDDARGVLEWMGARRVERCDGPRPNEEPVSWLTRLCDENGVERGKLKITHIDTNPNMEGKERLVVCIERRRDEATGYGHCGSLVLFVAIEHNSRKKRCGLEAISLYTTVMSEMQKSNHHPFPTFAKRTIVTVRPNRQGSVPVLNGAIPQSYDTVPPKTPAMIADSFGRERVPDAVTSKSSQWTLYADVKEMLLNHRRRRVADCGQGEYADIDIESLLRKPGAVLGRGGFGVTVRIGDDMVAKVNMFPEMVNWSVPFVVDDFRRYAHIALQMEEILIGVSIRHENVLRTFGGFWCETPGYQLGGRAVAIMEMAVCSLHEFSVIMGSNTGYVPLAELDTLNALDYLRRRAIQHRDITYRNILVCKANDRKPLPVVFKISDFGTACNFSTPDQPRGTRTNKSPEVLWCLEADTGTDVFSWYCVMWELYSGTPLIGYKAGDDAPSFCRKTYARNLSELVGAYKPTTTDAFRSEYMKGIGAEELCNRYSGARPSVSAILTKLVEKSKSTRYEVTDREFIEMGQLCITLFPQERYSPSELLSLQRYRALRTDVESARIPSAAIPSSVSAGEYETTDIVACGDCAPKAVTDGNELASVTTYNHTAKKFYGIDIMRLAPNYIEPYAWYSRKVAASKSCQGDVRNAAKRKACVQAEPRGVQRSKVHIPCSTVELDDRAHP